MHSTVPTESQKLRVIHLLHTMAYGGIETVIINWLTAIDRTQVEPRLVIFANPGQTEEPFRQAAAARNLSVDLIPWSHSKPIFKAARALRQLCRKYHTEILHTHNTYADIVGYLAARSLKLKVISTIYVWEDGDFGIRRKLLQQIDAWVLRRFDKLTAQCQKTIEDSEKWGFRPTEVELLPSGFSLTPAGLPPEERQRKRAERGASEQNIVVCNVARLYPEKAQDLMLHCWKRVIAECPHARLWIYGVGPLEEKLRQLCRELGLEETVSFLGFTSDLATELELCDVQFHPSHNEGIPLAICAGMAAGLPIVASNVGGLPEVIEHGKSGRLVPPGDTEGFCQELMALIRDPLQRKRLGEGARRFIQEEYSLTAAAKKLADLYRAILVQT
jgi:glycosyltransferase involved in cell wall biosynthesis